MQTFLLAALAGLLVCAPPGPLGALCVRTTALHGRAAGLCVGLGIALGESAHAAIAHYGAFDLGLWPRPARILVGGGLALLFGLLALRAWFSTPAPALERPAPARAGRGVAGTFLLSFATPGTLPAFVLIFSTFGIGRASGLSAIVAGVLCGSLAWWLLVTSLAHRLRDRLCASPQLLERACSAFFLLGAGGALRAAMS